MYWKDEREIQPVRPNSFPSRWVGHWSIWTDPVCEILTGGKPSAFRLKESSRTSTDGDTGDSKRSLDAKPHPECSHTY